MPLGTHLIHSGHALAVFWDAFSASGHAFDIFGRAFDACGHAVGPPGDVKCKPLAPFGHAPDAFGKASGAFWHALDALERILACI